MKLAVVDPTLRSGQLPADEAKMALKKGAAQFEGLLIKQLVKSMRKSTPLLSGGQGKMYTDMIDSALSDHLASVGGLGLAPQLERALGRGQQGPQNAQGQRSVSGATAPMSLVTPGRGAIAYQRAVGSAVNMHGDLRTGATGRLQRAAKDLLMSGASRWSKSGRLRPGDLASRFETAAAGGGGVARFNVRDAAGYEGHPKCNLFALEAARRGGFQVPVVPRDAGWGFPSAEDVTRSAQAGQLPWAQVVTGQSSDQLEASIQEGGGALLLTGAGAPGRAGHMALVERVRDVTFDDQGQVTQVVFDGWEARTGGGQYLRGRTWNLQGQRGGHLARNGFQQIEMIQLTAATDPDSAEQPTRNAAPRSLLDSFPSSSNP